MFTEPKILPWLARKAGVRLPVARAIWRSIASKSYADCDGVSCDEVARQQIYDLRQQLKEAGEQSQRRPEVESELGWIFPYPLFQTLAECQTRIVLSAWLAWARATQNVSQWSWHHKTSALGG
jgi:hypothetical protein